MTEPIELTKEAQLINEIQALRDIVEGGITHRNIKEYRTTYVINMQDSLDDTYPMLVPFNILSEMTKMVSVKVSFWILPFRAYSTAATEKVAVTSGASSETSSGASSAASSASGGSSTPTTSSGGSSTPTTSSGGGQTSSSGGGQTSSAPSGGTNIDAWCPTGAIAHNGGYLGASNRFVFVTKSTHTHTVSNHTHTVSNHTHTVTIGNHTHTVTIANHTHTVTIAAHTHDIPHTHNIPHTHTVPAHDHEITFGIFEEDNSPSIKFSISKDNGITYGDIVGTYSENKLNIEITSLVDTIGQKLIKFESTARARLAVQLEIKIDVSR